MRIQMLIGGMVLLCCMGCRMSENYWIKGCVQGLEKGEVFLVTVSGQDTVARTALDRGHFEFQGQVRELVPVLMTLGEQSLGGVMLYLENREYEVELLPQRMDGSTVKGGGEAQRIADGYRLCGEENLRAIDGVREEFLKLMPGEERFLVLSAYVDSLLHNREMRRAAYMEKYADSYLAIEELAVNAPRKTLEQLKKEYARFSPKFQRCFSGRVVAHWIEQLEKTGVGQTVPDYTLETPEGKEFTVYSIKGKVKLIEFWASWCRPCRKLIPDLKELYAKYRSEGLEILSISMDQDRENWLKTLETEKMPWPQGSDLKGNGRETPLVKAYGIFGLPFSVIVDENNRVLSRRFSDLKELEQIINEIINKE